VRVHLDQTAAPASHPLLLPPFRIHSTQHAFLCLRTSGRVRLFPVSTNPKFTGPHPMPPQPKLLPASRPVHLLFLLLGRLPSQCWSAWPSSAPSHGGGLPCPTALPHCLSSHSHSQLNDFTVTLQHTQRDWECVCVHKYNTCVCV
jgi:hypothetical protein